MMTGHKLADSLRAVVIGWLGESYDPDRRCPYDPDRVQPYEVDVLVEKLIAIVKSNHQDTEEEGGS